jgi:hypothetical protein
MKMMPRHPHHQPDLNCASLNKMLNLDGHRI